MTRDEFVENLLAIVEKLLPQTLGELAMEDRFRLSGHEDDVPLHVLLLSELLRRGVARAALAGGRGWGRIAPVGARAHRPDGANDIRGRGRFAPGTTTPGDRSYTGRAHDLPGLRASG